MAFKERNFSIPWPFAPKKIDLNTDTNLLKLVAMVTMLIDHAGKMLFPQYRIMRVIGRIAFPIYAYCLTVGCFYTRNMLKYIRRLVLLALISQPLYAVALGHQTLTMRTLSFAEAPISAAFTFYVESWSHPSILLALTMGVMLIWSLKDKQPVFTLALALLCWLIQDKLDYGIRGIILMVLFYVLAERRWLSLPVLAGYMIWWAMQSTGYTLFGIRFGIQVFALLALPLIYIHTKSGIRIPKWLFYCYYPAHLICILILDKFVF